MTSTEPPEGLMEFEDFYEQTQRDAYGSAFRVTNGDKQAAEDATQEAYVYMFRRWPEFCLRDPEYLQAYVMRTAVTKAIDHYRLSRRFSSIEDYQDPGATDAEIHDVDLGLSTVRMVRTVLERQTFTMRAVAELVFFQGRTQKEAAEALGIKPSTVGTHVQRLRALLEPFRSELLGSYDTTSGGGSS